MQASNPASGLAGIVALTVPARVVVVAGALVVVAAGVLVVVAVGALVVVAVGALVVVVVGVLVVVLVGGRGGGARRAGDGRSGEVAPAGAVLGARTAVIAHAVPAELAGVAGRASRRAVPVPVDVAHVPGHRGGVRAVGRGHGQVGPRDRAPQLRRLAVLVELVERLGPGRDPAAGHARRRRLDQTALGRRALRARAARTGFRHAGRGNGDRLRSAHKIRRTVLVGPGTAEIDRIDVVPDTLTWIGIEMEDSPARRDGDRVPVVLAPSASPAC